MEVSALKDLISRANAHPEKVAGVPSMITREEQAFLYLYARDIYSGSGSIEDAGVFLGASTRCFAKGLLERGFRSEGKPIRSYDLALSDYFMEKFIRSECGVERPTGTSFADLIEDRIVDHADMVDLVIGDITAEAPISEKVELLFIDCAKTAEVNRHVTANWFPRLIPGVSVVIQQDYVHQWLPWLHVTMGAFTDYFEYVGITGQAGGSAIWLCKKAIPADIAAVDHYRSDDLPRLKALFRSETDQLPEVARYFTDHAFACLLADKGRFAEAREVLDRTDLMFPRLKAECAHLPPSDSVRSFIGSKEARAA